LGYARDTFAPLRARCGARSRRDRQAGGRCGAVSSV